MKMHHAMSAIGWTLGLLLATARADLLVQWGENPTGAGTPGTNIVTASQNFLTRTTTYSGITNNPGVSSSYYSDNAGRSPLFSAAASVSLYNGLAEQAGAGDRITQYASVGAGLAFSGMVMWQANNFLTAGNAMTLTNLSLVINQRLNGNSINQSVHFVVGQGGNFYASQGLSLGVNYVTNSYSMASLTWSDFTPFNAGTASIGGATGAPSFDSVESVGYYFSVENGGASAANTGAQAPFFAAEGTAVVPEPATLMLFGVAGLLLLLRGRARGLPLKPAA